jgi:hypothetical protein
MPKALHIIMLLLVALVLAVPLAKSNLDPDGISDINEYGLPPFPALENNGSIINQAYSYTADRIGLRSRCVLTNQLISARLFKVIPSTNWQYGTDGQIFQNLVLDRSTLTFLTMYADYLAQMQAFCEQRGTTFLFVMTPSKSRVMQEYLPPGINFGDSFSADMMRPLLDERGIHYIDLADVLNANKDEYQVYYNQYDPGHWNETGAFLGVQAIFERLQEEYPQLEVPSFSDYQAIEQHYTHMPDSRFPIDETSPTYELIDPEAGAVEIEGLDEAVIRAAYRNMLRIYENPTIPDAPRTLFFTGSFFNYKDNESFNNFSYSANVHNYTNLLALPYYYNLFEPDIVLVDTADYVYYPFYYPTEGMLRTQFAEPFASFSGLEQQPLQPAEAFGAPDFSQPEAFCQTDPTGAGIYGTMTVVQPDVQGVCSLVASTSQPISNFYLTWAGPPIQALYAQIGDKIYDCCLTGSIAELGMWNDELEQAGSVTFLGVAADGSTIYTVTLPVV